MDRRKIEASSIEVPRQSMAAVIFCPYVDSYLQVFGLNDIMGILMVMQALVPEYLIKGEMTTLFGLYVTGIASKA